MHMNSPISQFSTSGTMGFYEASRHIWGESFKPDSSIYSGTSIISEADEKLDIATEEAMHENLVTLRGSDQEASKPSDKVLRRLAQNREAARKSRLRKKAYVQQLESSRLKLTQIEQEIDRARQQGLYISASSGDSSVSSGIINTGVVVFEMEYQHWVEEQNRRTSELRSALQAHDSDLNLRMLVESGLAHYDDLFRMKASAANSDVFHLLSGMWRTPAERFFLWIGGFRPSELLKILTPQLEPLTEQQVMAVCTLQQSSREAEDALSQGMDKLQQTLAETLVAAPPVGLSSSTLECVAQLTEAMRNLEALANFVVQADNLRQQTLQRMYRILTTRQAARGLLILGDYFQRLRALSSLWTARPREPT